MPQTPFEHLQQANDDYHEAVKEILEDTNVEIEVRVNFAAMIDKIFDQMTIARLYISKYY